MVLFKLSPSLYSHSSWSGGQGSGGRELYLLFLLFYTFSLTASIWLLPPLPLCNVWCWGQQFLIATSNGHFSAFILLFIFLPMLKQEFKVIDHPFNSSFKFHSLLIFLTLTLLPSCPQISSKTQSSGPSLEVSVLWGYILESLSSSLFSVCSESIVKILGFTYTGGGVSHFETGSFVVRIESKVLKSSVSYNIIYP